MKSVSWNMQDVRPSERFAYWREAVCQTYLPLEPEALSAGSFDGALTSFNADSLQLSRIDTVAQSVRRTRGGISAFQDGSFFANLQIAGEAVVEQHGGRTLARAGDIVLVDTNEPFAIRFEQGCNIICATIPGDRLRRHEQHVLRRPVSVISGRGAGRIAAAYLGALEHIPETFDLLDDLASDQLCALLIRAVTVDVCDATPRPGGRAMAQRILKFIADELHNPRLSAKYACRHLKVSRSYLFSALAQEGVTFASYIRRERLKRSLAQIRDPRSSHLAIGEIAQRWGFASQETFCRAFRRVYGVPPRGLSRLVVAARPMRMLQSQKWLDATRATEAASLERLGVGAIVCGRERSSWSRSSAG
jgi:AraC family transcriptional regulator, positive regulator of tynA and feaB